MAYDAHKNFAVSTVVTPPTPATTGVTLTVSDGTVYPAVPFNGTVYPLNTNPTKANSEIVRVTNIVGNTLTITRIQEASTARSIIVTDQLAATITAKTLTDIETTTIGAVAGSGLTLTGSLPFTISLTQNALAGGRLTLTSGTPVTTADVTAAATLYYSPYTGSLISLYDGSKWVTRSTAEISIAVPATTSQMYDVWVYDNAGTPALELLAWTNDTTRATGLTRLEGVYVKSGDSTRRYVGSFRTTTVAGQTEDSAAKRYVWNASNRAARTLFVKEATATWAGSGTVLRQVRGSTANQVDVVVGLAEVGVRLTANLAANNATTAGVGLATSIGFDSTTTTATGTQVMGNYTGAASAAVICPVAAYLTHFPTVGRHFYAWLERQVDATPANTTWFGDHTATAGTQSAIGGWIEG